MVLQVADGSVVVMKFEPMNAGDSQEEKTRMSGCIASFNPYCDQKLRCGGEGTCFVNIVSSYEWKAYRLK